MLTTFYKMIFDLSFYYSLAAFFVGAVFHQETNPLTFALLLLSSLIFSTAERVPGKKRVLSMVAAVLPALAFFWEHTASGRWEFIFPWVYLLILIFKENYGLDYYRFMGLFKGLLWTWLLYLVVTSFSPEGGLFGLEECVPYIVLVLVSGVMLLQALRYQEGCGSTKTFEKFQLRQTVAFLSFCLLLTVGRAMELVYLFVAQVLIPAGERLLYGIVSLLVPLFHAMPDIDIKPEQEYLEYFQEKVTAPSIEGIPSDVLENMAQTEQVVEKAIDWTPYLMAALILLAILIFAVLFGNSKGKQRVIADVDEREDMEAVKENRKQPKKHSLHPELVVRYYYRGFMKKAEWGNNRVIDSDTTADIATKFLGRKSDREKEAMEITELYRKVRYSKDTVNRDDAVRMKKLTKII